MLRLTMCVNISTTDWVLVRWESRGYSGGYILGDNMNQGKYVLQISQKNTVIWPFISKIMPQSGYDMMLEGKNGA